MGNSLKPFDELEGRTEQEREPMASPFAEGPFDRPVKKRPIHSRKP